MCEDIENKRKRKREYQAAWRRSKGKMPANRDSSDGKFFCPWCKELKWPTEFYRNVRSKHGISSYCKSCQKERSLKKYYQGK